MKFLPRLWHHERRRQLFKIAVVGLAQAAVTVSAAALAKFSFDSLYTQVEALNWQTLVITMLAYLVIAGLFVTLQISERVFSEQLGQEYVASLRVRLFRHLLNTQPRLRQNRRRGHLMLRFIGDINAVRLWVSRGVTQIIVAILSIPFALIGLASINESLALSAALLIISTSLIMLIVARPLTDKHRQARHRRSQIAGNLGEKLSQAMVIQVFGREQKELTRLRRQNRRLITAMVDRIYTKTLLRSIPKAANTVAIGVLLVVGIVEVSANQATPGDVLAALTVLGLLLASLSDFSRVIDYRREFLVARERLAAFFAIKRMRTSHQKLPDLVPNNGELRFEHLSIDKTLQQINASIKPGSIVAVSGSNGAGKSTLLLAAAGLIVPTQGRVLLDEQDLAHCDPLSFHCTIGLVSPDLPLLRGTIKSNLKLAETKVSDKHLQQIIEQCDLTEMLAQLPQGIDTQIMEGGHNLSAGLRQRLCLARALLVKPKLLLLDEADSGLDERGRRMLDAILKDCGASVLIATQDPTRLRSVDRVWHLENAQLSEVTQPDAGFLRQCYG